LNPTLLDAVRHHQAGQLTEADRLYAQVLAAEPDNAHALHLRGAIAHATGRHRDAVELISRAIAHDGTQPDFHYNLGLALSALGRRGESVGHWERTLAINPNHAAARLNLGNVLREDGRIGEAIAQHEAALRLWQAPATHNSLGLSLAGAARHDEAIVHFSRAIAMQSAFPEPYLNLAASLFATGRAADALGPAIRALELREGPESRALFVRIVRELPAHTESPALRGLLVRALDEGWTAPAVLAPACIALILNGPAAALIARAAQMWPERLPAATLCEPDGLAALDDPLLQSLMRVTVVANAALEAFLTACRFALAESAGTARDNIPLPFAFALAQQCFNNEYVYGVTDQERVRVTELRTCVERLLASGTDVPALALAAIAAYEPLHHIAGADALLQRDWPGPIGPLLMQQVREPRAEAVLRDRLPQFTPIEDEVSRSVRSQYEENPYPRWVKTAPPRQYASLSAFLRESFPRAPLQTLAKDTGLDILIAGCGTGQHAIQTARQHAGARVLAVDLSRTSLAYAAARSAALGVEVEYAQADIMRLGTLERRFDLIESVGVLHHMADPWAGWRVLASLLRPGGLMRIGLYSEIARSSIVAARKMIADGAYGTTADEMRRFRHDLMRRDDALAHDIMWFNDFYSLSECRDLVFHAQEHRMTIPQIGKFLAAEKLEFLAFETDDAATRRYAARFPADIAMTNLDCWHTFEQDNPRTFANMYRFWVQTQ
jgi:2-polyprenyl-3-methyl-5-hydroxy-6-metoxy-1,4-benzoquinol methylase/Flp pilus assembly protein TadD